MRIAKSTALLLAAVGLLWGTTALASGDAGHAAAAGDAAAHGEAHAGACTGDHWSLLDTIPALRHNLCGMFGTTVVEGTPVDRGMHVIMAAIVAIIALLFAFAAANALKNKEEALVPRTRFGFLIFFEMIVEAVLNTMVGMMGEKKARQYFPLIGALAIFILFSNLAGAIPGMLPPTDNLNTTFALGLTVFLVTHIAGVREHGIGYFKHFLGPIIKWYALPLMLIMVFIETISHLVRPASLAIRLMGNIFGDHKVLGIFLGFHLLLVPLPIQLLGLLVAIVQTLVFCLLSIVYIAMAVEHAEH